MEPTFERLLARLTASEVREKEQLDLLAMKRLLDDPRAFD